jgi:hypothetical protein
MVRLLADRGPMPIELAGKLLSPPALKPDDDATFREAVRRLTDLGIVRENADVLTLTGRFTDLDEFSAAMRHALFAPERNGELLTNQTLGSKDVTIFAAFFLNHDPLDEPVTDDVIYRDIAGGRTEDRAGRSNAATNDTRWNDFRYWAPALGLGTSPLFSGSARSALIPDCTVAVRQAMRAIGAANRAVTLPATELVGALRREIPVLPGGRYSRELGIPDPSNRFVDPALSFALLRGAHAHWLRLDRHDDAPTSVTLTDRTNPGRRVTDVTIFFEDLS